MSASAEAAVQRGHESAAPWPWTATWPLAMLTLISVFNYLDRSLFGLALPAIKREMVLSDTALGLVSGLAFVVVYSVLGLPIAWLSDRWSRRNIIAIGLAFWSVMTAVTGWVANVWQLAAARFLMGAGEASGIAPSNAMIADLFPPTRRPLAMALFGLASTISSALLFPIAGWIAEHQGWRAMFLAAGAPGLVLAVIFALTVREPPRAAPPPSQARRPGGSIWSDVAALFANRCFVWIFAGVTFMGANVWATSAWTPTFFQRVHGMGMAEAAAIIGPSRGILGAAGILAGGVLVDRLPATSRWRLGLPALACAFVGPAEALFLLGNGTGAWFVGFAGSSFFALIHQGPVYAATVNIVADRRRALAVAMILLGASLIGNAAGPTAVGMLNDYLAPTLGQLAMAFQLALGFAMPRHGPHSFVPMQLHKSVGISILLLTLVRLAWRVVRRPPEALEHGLAALLAKVVHWAFYAVLLFGPITGWIIVSTARLKVPTVLFGLVPWPHLPLPAALSEPMEGVHEALAWIAIGLFVLHVLGALRHQFLLRDPVIGRMAPAGSVAAGIVLLVATVALYFAVGSYVSQQYLIPALQERQAEHAGRAAANPPASPPLPVSSDETTPAIKPADAATARSSGPPPVWTIAGARNLAFSVANSDAAVKGSFRDWSGSIAMDPDHPETADIRIVVKLASASVGDATQDAMLQGAEFFASSANPVATWRSTGVVRTSPAHYRASGTLTIKGKSHAQAITFMLSGEGQVRHVTGSATIDRTAFGIGTGEAGESLGKLVSLSFAFDAAGRAG